MIGGMMKVSGGGVGVLTDGAGAATYTALSIMPDSIIDLLKNSTARARARVLPAPRTNAGRPFRPIPLSPRCMEDFENSIKQPRVNQVESFHLLPTALVGNWKGIKGKLR